MTAGTDVAVEQGAWPVVPERYNLAVDVCDNQDPSAIAMVWRDSRGRVARPTWEWMQHRAAQFGTFFRQREVRPGDRVACVLPPTPDAAAAILGALRVGAVLVVASPLWGADALGFRICDSDPTIVLTTHDGARTVPADYRDRVVIVESGLLDGIPGECAAAETRADDPAAIYYTSGTSGDPKGIVHAHRWLLGHNEFTVCHDLQPGELFHGAGDWAWSLAKLLGPWTARAVPFVFHQHRFDPAALFQALREEQVSNVLLNPTVLRRLRAAAPNIGEAGDWALRLAYCSSEPLPPELAAWFRDQFGIPLYDYYGLTESYPLIGTLPGEQVPPGAVGRALPGWDVALLDDHESPVPSGTVGEICLRAKTNPQYPLGYWNRPEDTEKVFGGAWFHTHDLAHQDPDGYVYFHGRGDDVIISSGYRIGPYEIEAVLDTHPAVAESAIVGDPDPDRGQIVHAHIVLADDQRPSEELTAQLQDHVRRHHSLFAYPRRVDYLDRLPRSTTNKIQRASLRAAAQGGHS